VRVTEEELERERVERLADEFDSDPAVQRGMKELAEAEGASHVESGRAYSGEDELREAIEALRKDTELEITTYARASVVQRAHCRMGDVHKLLGEYEEAVLAYRHALEVWRAYGYGENPVASLAATLIELGRLDEAIRVCEEGDEDEMDFCVQPVLAEARRLKAGGEPTPEPVPGGRRIKLPIRVTGRPGD
jgi:tetratricopeptide (TPR) repeat protein